LSHAPSSADSASPRWLFVTGRLAEGVVQRIVDQVSRKEGFQGEVHVVGISVAALMHVDWLKRKLVINQPYDLVFVPGWCQGDLTALEEQFGIPFRRGPKDILNLDTFLGGQNQPPIVLDQFDIEIIAEINHAPQFEASELLRQALEFRNAGADVIDLGCIPGITWTDVADVVRRLRDAGCRVSIDSFNRAEVESAVAAGAELVLSCNSTNRLWASQLAAELVVIPDDPARLDSMWETAEYLKQQHRPFRLDPILEPIGCGFAASLARYFETRRTDPVSPMMMGIGNLTELSDVDSAGVNFLLAAICQELRIHSVLTTQVINWARTSVAEFDLSRRLVKYAIDQQVPPKRLSPNLIMLRDPRLRELGEESLRKIAGQLKDRNVRVFVERGEIHLMNRDGYWHGHDPFELFDQLLAAGGELNASHAFYLGYELSKAMTALTLGKQYQQDQALSWGLLTIPEISAHERRRSRPASREET